MKTSVIALFLILLTHSDIAISDDTDIYLNPNVPSGAEPLVMFSLDYRSNLTSTVCNGNECDDLIADGYLPPVGPYNFFQLLRAVLQKVLDPLTGVRIGFMISHDDSCTGNPTSGPNMMKCSNGGYILHGFTSMAAGTDDPETFQTVGEDANKLALFNKLAAIPDPQGNVAHSFQGKELYFELFRYLTGQGIYNGHIGYTDYNDSNNNTNLDHDLPAVAWDSSIETGGNSTYVSPISALNKCARIFVINLMFQVSNQEDDSDSAITETKVNGGMQGINLSGSNNNFDTVIEYLNDADLADGSYGTVPDITGIQNVISYFLVDPTKVNQTTNGYAQAGGTAVALELSEDPTELIGTLNNIFKSILSISTTFVAPSVPVNVFNRAQIVNEVFMAIFEAEENGFPLWNGNLKKLRIEENAITSALELQDANGINAIDIDGRIKRNAVTFWTQPGSLSAPVDDEVAGADGRSVARGGAGQNIPGFINGTPQLSNGVAGARLMYTEDSSDLTDGLMPLNADAATAALLWSELTANWNPAASSPTYAGATASEKKKAVTLLLFARGLQDDGVTTRNWIMGDPLHSRPRPINYGARGGGYDASNPDIRIVMGTNDGVVHMFTNTTTGGSEDGGEAWGFVPYAVLPLLDRLHSNSAGTPVHPIATDSSPTILAIDANGDASYVAADSDKVYAFFGLRRGGKYIYAMDISDPDSPKLAWTIEKGALGSDFATLAQTWSEPSFGKVAIGADTKYVLVFGGGYNGDDDGDNLGDLGKDAKNRTTNTGGIPVPGTDDDEGNGIFVVNAQDGTLIWKAILGAGSSYSAALTAYLHPDLKDSFAAPLSAIDTTGNGLLDRIYATDTGGTVWRVDLAGQVDHDSNPATLDIIVNNDVSAWSINRLLSVGRHVAGQSTIADDRRFFNAPDVAQSRDSTGPFDAVIIGSGDREDPNGTDVNNFFYVVKDRYITSGIPPAAVIEHDDLADLSDNCLQDNSCAIAPDLTNGWRIALADTGEKNLARAITIGGEIFFTSFSPTVVGQSCNLGEGTGRLYAVSLTDATAVYNFDTTNDLNNTETLERIDQLESGGIPVQVVPLAEGYILVQGQKSGENIVKVNGKTSFDTFWREIYR